MALQENSWVRPEGVPEHPGLVGQVFFPFDSDELDMEDRGLLAELAGRYQTVLLGHRIELMFVGHADKRGNAEYNRKLGLRRARAVRQHVDQMLGSSRFTFYSSKDALSRGELDATQGKASVQQMAEDRRVDIFSSYVPARRIELPPIYIEASPPARRLGKREFRSTKGKDMFDMTNPDPLGDAIANLIKYAGTKGESLYGNEAKQSRKVVTVPVTHRVNVVKIHTESSAKKGIGYEVEASNTYVAYEWGPPRPTVTVTWSTHAKDLNSGRATRKTRTKTFPRGEMAGNAVIFPPDPQ